MEYSFQKSFELGVHSSEILLFIVNGLIMYWNNGSMGYRDEKNLIS